VKKFIDLLANDSFKTFIEILVLTFAVLGIWLAKFSNDAAVAANQAAMAANEISRATFEEMQAQYNKAFEPELVVETTYATVYWAENNDGIYVTNIVSEVERLGELPSHDGIPINIVNIGQGTAKDITITYQIQAISEENADKMDLLIDYYRTEKIYFDLWEVNNFRQLYKMMFNKPFLLGNVQESWQFNIHREVISWLGYTLFDIRGAYLRDPNHPDVYGTLIAFKVRLDIECYDMQGRLFTEQREIEIRQTHSMWHVNEGIGTTSIMIHMVKPESN